MKTAADFGLQLRHERERQGVKQAELAEKADVSVRWLSNFERGKSPRAELTKVVHVARALGMTFEFAEERQVELPEEHRELVDAFRNRSGIAVGSRRPSLIEVVTRRGEE